MNIFDKLNSQAEQVELVDLQEEKTTVVYENNRLKTSLVQETKGTAVRVVKNGRLGFSASTDANAADKLVRNVLESAEYGEEVPIIFPGKEPLLEVNSFDEKITNLPISTMVDMGQEIVDTFLGFDPGLKVNVTIDRGNRQLEIKNQTGLNLSDKCSPFSIGFELVRVHGDDVLIIFALHGNTVWKEDYLEPIQKAGKLLKLAERSGEIKSGKMPVLFSPNGALALTIPLLNGLDGKMAYTGISPLKDRIGDKVFSDKLTVIDNPTLSGRYSSSPFDDEGVATRKNILVDRGEMKSFFYDLKTAAQAGVTPTGNGSRGLFTPPVPSSSNFIIEPGQTPLAEMIAGIEEGLWVEDVIGIGQGNVVSGAFSNPLSLAYKIEKGEITGRVKDVSIAGNIYDLLPNIAAISQESDWVYNSFNIPHILIDGMNVVTKE